MIEVLMVIGLMAILAVLSIGVLQDSQDEQRFQITTQRMSQIRSAILGKSYYTTNQANFTTVTATDSSGNAFLQDMGAIPTNLKDLWANPGGTTFSVEPLTHIGFGWNGPYLSIADTGTDFTLDGWGNPFVYSTGSDPATLLSYGADGKVGGAGLNQDITIQIPFSLATVNGVIVNGAAQFSSAAEVEVNTPDGSGALLQTIYPVAAPDKGAFTANSVPFGLRSATVYVPNKAGATSTYGPLLFTVDRLNSSVVLNILTGVAATPTPTPGIEMDNTWTPQWANMVGLWHLNETSPGVGGHDFADSTSNSAWLTVTPMGVMGTAGKLGNAASFDGLTYFTKGSGAALPINNNPRSIVFWAYPTALGSQWHDIMMYGALSGNAMTWLGINNSNQWFVSQYGTGLSGNVAAINHWTHIGLTYDGATYHFYQDGVEVIAGPMPTSTAAGAIVFGKETDNSAYYQGLLDEVGVWNTFLSPADISTIYNNQK